MIHRYAVTKPYSSIPGPDTPPTHALQCHPSHHHHTYARLNIELEAPWIDVHTLVVDRGSHSPHAWLYARLGSVVENNSPRVGRTEQITTTQCGLPYPPHSLSTVYYHIRASAHIIAFHYLIHLTSPYSIICATHFRG